MVLRVVLAVLLLASALAEAQKFYPDDPIRGDQDAIPIDRPAFVELSPTYDLLENSFLHRPEAAPPRAMNVNTLGEVPDSSWFTNRIGARDWSVEEILLGPNVTGERDFSNDVTIIRAKQGGITAGFTVRDRADRVYFLKFDPEDHPHLTTSADVISKQFFYAIGYNVPENYIVYLRREQFRIDPEATVNLAGGKRAPMDEAYLDVMLDTAPREADGRIRAVASLRIPGEPVGPFRFYRTRRDDPNDVFPHEHRRELRGYRLFSAWLNHDDSRSINTLDVFVKNDGDRGFVKHYLIDFGSTLGSGSDVHRRVAPQHPRAGNEYLIELGPTWKTAYTFGIWERPWMKVRYRYPELPEIGRIEADFFDPRSWRPEYPNPAFDRMLADDAFWAAKILVRFSDEAIRAVVATGQFSDPEAEAYLAETLVKRRDKIIDLYYRELNPLDSFRLVSGELDFENLGELRGLGRVEGYSYEWFRLDNATGVATPLEEQGTVSQSRLPLPASLAGFLVVRLRTQSTVENWGLAVDVTIEPGAAKVVGIEREIPPWERNE